MVAKPDQQNTLVPAAKPVEGRLLFEAVRDLGITHVITVPDSVQKTFLALVEAQDQIKLLTVCTEAEAMGINAGLYATGHRPMMSIQNNGFYASINTLKAIAF